jgi:hypothetical protein
MVLFSENRYLTKLVSLFLHLARCPAYFSSSVNMIMSLETLASARSAYRHLLVTYWHIKGILKPCDGNVSPVQPQAHTVLCP